MHPTDEKQRMKEANTGTDACQESQGTRANRSKRKSLQRDYMENLRKEQIGKHTRHTTRLGLGESKQKMTDIEGGCKGECLKENRLNPV